MKETKNYFLILLMVAIFSVFNPSPEIPGGLVAGVTVRNSVGVGAGFLDFPIVPDSRLVLIPVSKNTAKSPEISAKAVLAADIGSGTVIFERNSAEKLPIASLTKLMTALVVVEQAPLDDQVEILAEDLDTVPFRLNFSPGERLTIRDLVTAMLVSSANDAALALARHTAGSRQNFVAAMNDKALKLGMVSTSFTNPVGFDHPNHYSTAADLSALVEEFINHAALVDIVKMKSAEITSEPSGRKLAIYTTNKLLLERSSVIGLKTGFTAEAKGSLIILVDRQTTGEPVRYYSIILGSDDREQETRMLMDWIEDNFVWQ